MNVGKSLTVVKDIGSIYSGGSSVTLLKSDKSIEKLVTNSGFSVTWKLL